MKRTITLPVLFTSAACAAQLFTSNGAAITVQSGAQLTVKGDLLAGAASAISNTGIIDLNGDLTNNSGGTLFNALPGAVVMNGAAQTIAGSSVTAFDDLDLQCVTLTLQQDVLVGGGYPSPAGVLQLRDAIVQLNAHRLVINAPTPAAMTRLTGQLVSETDPITGYGEVEWNIGGSTGVYVVPFGDGVTYIPVTLSLGVAGSPDGHFVFATYPTDPSALPNNRPLPAGLGALTDVNGVENAPNVVDRFWPITTHNYITQPTAALVFTYRDSEWNSGTNAIIESALQAQHFNGTQWSQPPNGVANVGSNTVTTAPTDSFDLVWALTEGFAALPVELLYFDARPEGDAVDCRWSTASETGNDFFTVERSADGRQFIGIGTVDAAGDPNDPTEYAFTDHEPLKGLSYYRLRQTDLDGSTTLSNMVAVWIDEVAVGGEWTLFPNPTNGDVYVAGMQGGEHVTVLDAGGREVLGSQAASTSVVHLDLSSLVDGTYIVHIRAPKNERSLRSIKITL